MCGRRHPADSRPAEPVPRARVVRFVSQEFYIRAGRGSGAIWHVMRADSAEEIRARYPFVDVAARRPSWWSFRHHFPALDIDADNPTLERMRDAHAALHPLRQMQLALGALSLLVVVTITLL